MQQLETAEGLVNLRDVGGLPLVQGGATRTGVLLRSDVPLVGDPTPADQLPWPPPLVLDLRSEPELLMDGAFHWGDDTVVMAMDVARDAAPIMAAEHFDMVDLYQVILDGLAPFVPDLFATLADTTDFPVLVHCAAGKDRTGVLAAALLLAAGVRNDAVMKDYLATEANMPAFLRRHPEIQQRYGGLVPEEVGRPGPFSHALALSPAAILDVMRTLGGPGEPRWLLEQGADPAHLAAWRTRLADPTAPVEP